MADHFPLRLFQQLLLGWYKKYGRDLPWREKYANTAVFLRDPYRIVVSELMLQQTQVSRVIPKFYAFLEHWPTLADLAQAKLSEVIIAWKGLGYNRRAKHLLETAKIITQSYQGIFPRTREQLTDLPGFGPYMVSAIRVFAFHEQDSVIDVNVSRVYERVMSGEAVSKQQLGAIAQESVPNGQSDTWHQAMMDFGALICTAKVPKCDHCPLARICQANKRAKAQGFLSFAAWLLTQPKKKKMKGKDAGKKFEETDRFFRGRIIDFLRSGERSMQEVQDHIVITHALGDRKRFGNLIEDLVTDGLITVHINRVSLP